MNTLICLYCGKKSGRGLSCKVCGAPTYDIYNLISCPECGKLPEVDWYGGGNLSLSCECYGGFSGDPRRVIEGWNSRARYKYNMSGIRKLKYHLYEWFGSNCPY